MPKYIRQPHKSSCGPTAIINAGKWAGNKLTLKRDYRRVYLNTHCDSDGSDIKYIDKTLRNELGDFLNIRKVRKPDIRDTVAHIKRGGAALISYSFYDPDEPDGEGCHIAFFSDIWENDWVAHNFYSYEVNSFVPHNRMIECFYMSPSPIVVWHIRRKNGN